MLQKTAQSQLPFLAALKVFCDWVRGTPALAQAREVAQAAADSQLDCRLAPLVNGVLRVRVHGFMYIMPHQGVELVFL